MGVYQDLTPLVNVEEVQCLNQDRRYAVRLVAADALCRRSPLGLRVVFRFTHKNLWKSDDRLLLKSDLDPQLLLIIPFRTMVKVHSINLVAPTDDAGAQLSPSLHTALVLAHRRCVLVLLRDSSFAHVFEDLCQQIVHGLR